MSLFRVKTGGGEQRVLSRNNEGNIAGNQGGHCVPLCLRPAMSCRMVLHFILVSKGAVFVPSREEGERHETSQT